MKRTLLCLLCVFPLLCWAQVPLNEKGKLAIETLSAEILRMQGEVRSCPRVHSKEYCTLHASQLTILTEYRATLCKQFEVPRGELECP